MIHKHTPLPSSSQQFCGLFTQTALSKLLPLWLWFVSLSPIDGDCLKRRECFLFVLVPTACRSGRKTVGTKDGWEEEGEPSAFSSCIF